MFVTLAQESNSNQNENDAIQTTGVLRVETTSKKKGNAPVVKQIKVRVSMVNGQPVLELQHEEKAMQVVTSESKIRQLKRHVIEEILTHFVGACMFRSYEHTILV